MLRQGPPPQSLHTPQSSDEEKEREREWRRKNALAATSLEIERNRKIAKKIERREEEKRENDTLTMAAGSPASTSSLSGFPPTN
jgi:hypothetical protein